MIVFLVERRLPGGKWEPVPCYASYAKSYRRKEARWSAKEMGGCRIGREKPACMYLFRVARYERSER